MKHYELVLRREGEQDEVVSMASDHLTVGQPFVRDGIKWVVAKDDGRSELPNHAVRLICEPGDEAIGAVWANASSCAAAAPEKRHRQRQPRGTRTA
jgi:hypothetical protein